MARKHFVRGGKSVRETFWIGNTGSISNLAAASTAAIILSPAAGLLALRPYTIVRTV